MSGILQLKTTFVEKMGEEQRLVRVIEVLRNAKPSAVGDIARYLSALRPSTLPILLDLLESLDAPEHRLVVCDAIAEFAKVNAVDVIQRLSSERPMTVRDMVYVLEKAHHADRMRLFGRVLKHKNLAVRLDVMATIARGKEQRVAEADRRGAAGREPSSEGPGRPTAPGVRPGAGLPRAGLGGAAAGTSSDAAPRSRRRSTPRWGAPGLPAAISLMTQLLEEKPQLWNRGKVLEEKLLAVHGLAGVQSIQSYKALQTVTEDRDPAHRGAGRRPPGAGRNPAQAVRRCPPARRGRLVPRPGCADRCDGQSSRCDAQTRPCAARRATRHASAARSSCAPSRVGLCHLAMLTTSRSRHLWPTI